LRAADAWTFPGSELLLLPYVLVAGENQRKVRVYAAAADSHAVTGVPVG